MAYKLNYTDTTLGSITVLDGTINPDDTTLTFVGKNYYGYGEIINQDLLWLLENFAGHYGPNGENLPGNGIEGQMVYNKDTGSMFIYGGAGGSGSGSTPDWNPITVGGAGDIAIKSADTGLTNVCGGITLPDENGDLQTIVIFSAIDFNVDPTDPLYDSVGNGNGFRRIRKGATIRGYNATSDASVPTGANADLHYTFAGTSRSALYSNGADLAEMYYSDQPYEPGTLVRIGGEAEITATIEAADINVFGVVSTDPAYVMNAGAVGTVCAIALAGRVPVKVIGKVNKGDRLVSAGAEGYARVALPTEAMDWRVVFGRALTDKDTDGEGVVEVIVGVK